MKSVLKYFSGITVFILLWHALVLLFAIPQYLVPSPLSTWQALIDNSQILWSNLLVTGAEVLLGFVIANVFGVFIALVVAFFPKAESAAISSAVILKTIPIIAIAPLLVLWFGSGMGSKVAAVIIISFFPAIVNLLRGIKSLDSSTRDLMLLYSPSRIQAVRYFILPGIMPFLFSALKVSSTLAVVGALVSEFISANSGLGFLIISSYYTFNIPLVFATLIITSILGLVLYGAIEIIEVRATPTKDINS